MVELPSSDAMDGDRISVLIADSWWIFREGAAQAIETWPEYEPVAAVTAEECVTTLQKLRPDVALIDPAGLSTANEQAIFTHIRDNDARVLFLSRPCF
jgi:DNA-binding NarL/FixJ family response regulator